MGTKSRLGTSSPSPSSGSSLSNAARQRHRHQQEHQFSNGGGAAGGAIGRNAKSTVSRDGGENKYDKSRFASAVRGIMPAPLPGLRPSSSVAAPSASSKLSAKSRGAAATSTACFRVCLAVMGLVFVAVLVPNLASSGDEVKAPADSATSPLASLTRPLDRANDELSSSRSDLDSDGTKENSADDGPVKSDSETRQKQNDDESPNEVAGGLDVPAGDKDAKATGETDRGDTASNAEVQEENHDIPGEATPETETENDPPEINDDDTDAAENVKSDDAERAPDVVKAPDASEEETALGNEEDENETKEEKESKEGSETKEEKEAEEENETEEEKEAEEENETEEEEEAAKEQKSDNSSDAAPFQCGVYAAPSNIPGGGIGLFAGKDFSKLDAVLPPDLVVPLTDMLYHNCGHRKYDSNEQPFLWSNYVWSWRSVHLPGDVIIPVGGVENDWVSPGGGAMLNHHFVLKNVKETSILLDEEADTDNQSPHSGSFTPYYHRVSAATMDIEAGAELYTSYGASWFDSRMDATGVVVPQTEDYTFCDRLLKKFERHVLKRPAPPKATPPPKRKKSSLRGSSNVKNALQIQSSTDNDAASSASRRRLTITTSLSPTEVTSVLAALNGSEAMLEAAWNVTRYTVSLHDAKRHAAMPTNLEDVLRALEIGAKYVANPVVLQSQEWLQENGRCMDSLQVKTSTIPQAGRGVFTKHAVKKGEVIHTAPLIHIANAHSLNMYPIHYDDDKEVWEEGGVVGEIDFPEHCPEAGSQGPDEEEASSRNTTQKKKKKKETAPIGQQLLLNYAFGHPNTTLLLTPYSPTSMFINHHSEAPNAEIRWPPSGLGVLNHDPSYFEKTVEELSYIGSPGLVLEFVATRDIAPDEEVFIHYGKEWQEAWDQHVETWNKKQKWRRKNKRWGPIVTAKSMNEEDEETNRVIRTQDEQEKSPYPESVFLVCRATFQQSKQGESDNTTTTVQYVERRVRRRESREQQMRPCQILQRTVVPEKKGTNNETLSESFHLYTVSSLRSTDNPLEKTARQDRITIEGVPREAIAFRDRVYRARPFHGSGVFRHKMMLPDHLYAQAWTDK